MRHRLSRLLQRHPIETLQRWRCRRTWPEVARVEISARSTFILQALIAVPFTRLSSTVLWLTTLSALVAHTRLALLLLALFVLLIFLFALLLFALLALLFLLLALLLFTLIVLLIFLLALLLFALLALLFFLLTLLLFALIILLLALLFFALIILLFFLRVLLLFALLSPTAPSAVLFLMSTSFFVFIACQCDDRQSIA
jgi:hypothetical protein